MKYNAKPLSPKNRKILEFISNQNTPEEGLSLQEWLKLKYPKQILKSTHTKYRALNAAFSVFKEHGLVDIVVIPEGNIHLCKISELGRREVKHPSASFEELRERWDEERGSDAQIKVLGALARESSLIPKTEAQVSSFLPDVEAKNVGRTLRHLIDEKEAQIVMEEKKRYGQI